MSWIRSCYIVRRGSATQSKNPTGNAFATGSAFAILLLTAGTAGAAHSLPVSVGQDADTVVAALRSKGIDFKQETLPSGQRITYSDGSARVTLELALWPRDADAPAEAWEPGSKSAKQMTLVRIEDVAPGSDERRAWVRTFEKEGHRWAYLSPEASAARPAEERKKYPVAAFLQWSKPGRSEPWVTFLFEAARPPGSPPGGETTALAVSLENPHRLRRF